MNLLNLNDLYIALVYFSIQTSTKQILTIIIAFMSKKTLVISILKTAIMMSNQRKLT